MSRISLFPEVDNAVDSIHAQLDALESSRPEPAGTWSSAQYQSETFFQQLSARVASADTLLCVGLDPHAADIGAGLSPLFLP